MATIETLARSKRITIIIVSHRFQVFRSADVIIVLDQGKIVGKGTHEELVEQDGYYARAERMQSVNGSGGIDLWEEP